MATTDELLDILMKDYKKPVDLIGENGLLKQLTKRLLERAMLCIVHMVRHSLNYVSWKQRKEVATDLKTIYQAPTVEMAEKNLEAFAAKWDASHPTIARSWRNNWERIIPLFSYPTEIRKAIYTTNAIESLNMSLRKVTKNRGHFPSDVAMFKLLYLALKNIAKKWTMPIRDWKSALNQLSIIFGERLLNF